jgi:Skp family chaperone for outer membrane proteins
MKKTIGYLALVFTICFSSVVLSKEQIYYIDMDFIMNNSLAGKSIVKQLEQKSKSYSDTIKKNESNLKKEEAKLIAQKNIINQTEFDKKLKLFTEKVSKYKLKHSDVLTNFSKQKINAQQDLVNKLTPILANYAKKNSISFIIPKQNIIIGKTELDLTKKIITILNKQVKSINLE